MDMVEAELHYSKLIKRKNQTFSRKEELLELKPRRRRQGKCVGAALEVVDFIENKQQMVATSEQKQESFISDDIWFHLANYIAPEDVQRYSLICSQSANSVNSSSFWLQMYRRYCLRSRCYATKSLKLPHHLEMQQIKNCDRNTLRQKVIQTLFYCYPPFKIRLKSSYNLKTLVGRTYISSWYKQVECVWIMCYKFKMNFPLTTAKVSEIKSDIDDDESASNYVADDWECLTEKENYLCNTKKSHSSTTPTVNDLDGIRILVISCNRFIPFPSDIVYNHSTGLFRLAAARQLLSTDMQSNNLELDFISNSGDQTIAVKYTKIQKFEIFPWWHPDFRILNNCE